MSGSVRTQGGAGATLRLLLEATPIPPGFEDGGGGDDVEADVIIEAFERAGFSDVRAEYQPLLTNAAAGATPYFLVARRPT